MPAGNFVLMDLKNGSVVNPSSGFATDDFLFKSATLPAAGTTNGTLLFFDQSKAALRGGAIIGSQWEPAKI